MSKTFRLYILLLFCTFSVTVNAKDDEKIPEIFSRTVAGNTTGGDIVKYGLINYESSDKSRGGIVLEAKYDKIWPFAPCGLALVKTANRYGYVDTKGKFVLEVGSLVDAKSFNEFNIAIVKQKNKWGVVNTQMKWEAKDIYDKIDDYQSNGLAVVKYEGKYGLIDTVGNLVLPVIYDKVEDFNKTGYALVKINKMLGVIDTRGRAVVKPDCKDKKTAMAALADYQKNRKAINEELLAEKKDERNSVTIPVVVNFDFFRKIDTDLASTRVSDNVADESDNKTVEDKQIAEAAEKAEKERIAKEAEEKRLMAEAAAKAEQERRAKEAEEKRLMAEAAAKAEQERRAKEAEEKRLMAEAAAKAEQERLAKEAEEKRLMAEKAQAAEKAEKERIAKEAEEKRLLAEAAEKARIEEEKRKEAARRLLAETPTLRNYIAANLGEWNDYLSSKNLNIPSDEEVRAMIEKEIAVWQVKGEFEPTVKWKERVNEDTRNAKIKALADSVYSSNSKLIEDYRAEYQKNYETLVDKYCSNISEQFSSQTLIMMPYDADNETFLISTNDFGDFLLPVPLAEAPGFKQEWDKWKDAAIAKFVPNGEDVILKSVNIGKYSYDSDMNATYAQVDVDYNFTPVDVSMIGSHQDLSEGLAMNVNENSAVKTPGFKAQKVKLSAGNAVDVDFNIPDGKKAASNTFAVVIANGEYAHASKVNHAENDGRVMAKYLTKTLGIPESNVALFINATYGQMASAISTLQDIGDAYRGSDFNIMFYYVGHGLPDDDGKKSYILPVDIDPRHASICMPLEKIYADLGNLGANNVTVMVDACFSGTNHGDGMLIPQSMGVALRPKKANPVGNMVVLAATEGNETAFPYDEKSHGLFTYWLLKKLQDTAGQVTFGELSDYVIDNVKKTSVTVNRKPQTPTVATSPQLADSWRTLKFGN